MAGTIYLDLCDDIFPRIKNAAELRTRLRKDLTEEIVVTDSDLSVFEDYFKEFAAEFRNETGTFDDLRENGGQLTYKLTDTEKEGGMDELKDLLIRIARENLLYRWYDDLGVGDLARNAWGKYEALRDEFVNNNAQKKFYQPKYHPYW